MWNLSSLTRYQLSSPVLQGRFLTTVSLGQSLTVVIRCHWTVVFMFLFDFGIFYFLGRLNAWAICDCICSHILISLGRRLEKFHFRRISLSQFPRFLNKSWNCSFSRLNVQSHLWFGFYRPYYIFIFKMFLCLLIVYP